MKRGLIATGAAAAMLALAGAAPAAVQVSQSGWSWGNSQPQGNTIRAIDFAGGRGYAVGAAGTALRTDDGGATWSGLATGTSADLDRLQVVTPDVVVVQGGDGCAVRRTDDGGATFRRIFVVAEAGCPDPVRVVFFVDPQVGYLVLADGSVLRTGDAGETFSRQTAIPGTPASTGGGGATPADAWFTGPDAGIVFMADTRTAYRTTDQGISWTPVTAREPGDVRRILFADAQTAYAVGESTLLRSTDGGQSWQRRPGGAGEALTSIRCADASTCLLTTVRGDRVLRTTDGGETVTPITPSTQAIHAAAFASAAHVVAAGAGGATVVSGDGGVNYSPVGGDIGGTYPYGLRAGPAPGTAYALGARGQLARTVDGGVTWRALSAPTSADVVDLSFAGAEVGYVIDRRGGLFRTANGGQSWQTLDPGATGASGLLTSGPDVVLLAGPRGIRRQSGGGRFEPVASGALRDARVNRLDRAGTAVVAYGTGLVRAALSGDRGRRWRTLRLPRAGGRPVTVRDLDFVSSARGYVVDARGRLWTTANGGRSWTELLGAGSHDLRSVAFGSATQGFVTLGRFAGDPSRATVLRTSNGGRTWRPQRIAVGQPAIDGILAPSGARAYALTGFGGFFRSLFTTATGGDAGQPSSISLTARSRTLSRPALRRAGNRVTVTGRLPGAAGGEPIVVSARGASATAWQQQVVEAGANDGSFTATFRIAGTSVFVAQFPGDSGRRGAGSRVLTVRVR